MRKREYVFIKDHMSRHYDFACGWNKTFVSSIHIAEVQKHTLFGMKVELMMIKGAKKWVACTAENTHK